MRKNKSFKIDSLAIIFIISSIIIIGLCGYIYMLYENHINEILKLKAKAQDMANEIVSLQEELGITNLSD